MFAVIYRGFVFPEREKEYKQLWHTIASYFVKNRGALESRLHKTDAGEYIAYSRWPDRKTRDLSWGDASTQMPAQIVTAIQHLKECLDYSKSYDEICMDVVDEN